MRIVLVAIVLKALKLIHKCGVGLYILEFAMCLVGLVGYYLMSDDSALLVSYSHDSRQTKAVLSKPILPAIISLCGQNEVARDTSIRLVHGRNEIIGSCLHARGRDITTGGISTSF